MKVDVNGSSATDKFHRVETLEKTNYKKIDKIILKIRNVKF